MFAYHVTTRTATSATPKAKSGPNQYKTELLGYQEFRQILEIIRPDKLIARLKEYRFNGHKYHGRKQYPVETMWSTILLLYYLNLPSVNELIRRLQDSAELRTICGFTGGLPSRATFNRAYNRISGHMDLLEVTSEKVVTQLQSALPDFGQEISVDSTVVPTYANPWRKSKKRVTERSDPEAGWTQKNSVRAKKGGKEWFYGYKFHAVADANWNIPICGITTSARRNDTLYLRPLVKKMSDFTKPKVAIADRGYDSKKNHEYLIGEEILPVIRIRDSNAKNGLYDKQFDFAGNPLCPCGEKADLAFDLGDVGLGDHYICPKAENNEGAEGEHIADWYAADRNVRLRGPIHRESELWSDLYDKRQSVERVFKSMKQSLRLDRHYHRSLKMVWLHCLLSMLVFQLTVLVKALAGDFDELCWMTRRIA